MLFTINENEVLHEGEHPGQRVGIFSFEEMDETAARFGIPAAFCGDVRKSRYTKYESHPDGHWLTLNVPSTWQKELVTHRVAVFLGDGQLFFFSDDLPLIREAVTPRLSDGGKTCRELLLRDFLDHLAARDSLYLDELEQEILKLEDDLITGGKSDYVATIITFRRQLMTLKQYYEQLCDLVDAMLDDESGVLPKHCRRSFQALGAKLDRICHTILNLRDYVTQVRESYQAQEDIRLNRVMKYFTVISTIFLPLTLIVGWYGMNVAMPEYHWRYGYAWVIVLCVAAVAGCIAFFRKNKWF